MVGRSQDGSESTHSRAALETHSGKLGNAPPALFGDATTKIGTTEQFHGKRLLLTQSLTHPHINEHTPHNQLFATPADLSHPFHPSHPLNTRAAAGRALAIVQGCLGP